MKIIPGFEPDPFRNTSWMSIFDEMPALPPAAFVSNGAEIEQANIDEWQRSVKEYASRGAPCPICGESCTKDGVTWVDKEGRCVNCAPSDEPVYCPECGCEFANDANEATSIADHGRCVSCHKKWQNGELYDEVSPCPDCDQYDCLCVKPLVELIKMPEGKYADGCLYIGIRGYLRDTRDDISIVDFGLIEDHQEIPTECLKVHEKGS